MISMGIMINLGGMLTLLEAYLVRIYISNTGDLSDVGMFNAGLAIISTYVGMIFTAMGKDYYPRLSEVANDINETNNTVIQQAEIALLILAPLLIIFIIFINWGIIILYSSKFLPITDMIHWAALGIFFKVPTWTMGFILLAKGDGKWFFWTQLIGVLYMLPLNILGYKFFGLEGLGISFLVVFIISFILNLTITYFKYSFKFSLEFYKIFGIVFGIAIIGFLLSYKVQGILLYIIGFMLISISTFYSYKELDKRLDLVEIVGSFKNRFIKK